MKDTQKAADVQEPARCPTCRSRPRRRKARRHREAPQDRTGQEHDSLRRLADDNACRRTPPPPPAARARRRAAARGRPVAERHAPQAADAGNEAPEATAARDDSPEANAPETKAPETKPRPWLRRPPAPRLPESSFIGELIERYADCGRSALAAARYRRPAWRGLIAARRRKTTKFEDSIISGTDIKTNTVFGSTGGGVVNTGDNSLASDFSREGLGSIDTDEVDPIAEAEVYLAYGRDAQAEEILKEALKKDPQRQEIYLKLLEIHAQHNKPSAFETVASELYSVSGGQGEVWQKAMALGRQLDPNNPLFAETGGAAAFAAAAAAEGEHRVATGEARSGTGRARAGRAVCGGAPRPNGRIQGHRFHARRRHLALADSEVAPKTPAAILAGAAQEVAKSTRAGFRHA